MSNIFEENYDKNFNIHICNLLSLLEQGQVHFVEVALAILFYANVWLEWRTSMKEHLKLIFNCQYSLDIIYLCFFFFLAYLFLCLMLGF